MRLKTFAVIAIAATGLAACAADTPPRSASSPGVTVPSAGSSTQPVRKRTGGSLTGTYDPAPPPLYR